MTKKEIGQTLKKLREGCGMSREEVAAILEKSSKTIGHWESGYAMPDANMLFLLCSIYEADINEAFGFGPSEDEKELSSDEFSHIKKYRVLDTHGKKVVDTALDLEYDRMTHIESREEKGWITYINLYDLAVSAGTGEPLGDTDYKTRIEIPTERVPENAHCCLRVNGDSMEPAYKDGDIVFVQRQDEPVREGEIGVFSLNGEGYMKRLGDKELESLNPKYPAIPIRQYDDLRCFGRVLGKLSM